MKAKRFLRGLFHYSIGVIRLKTKEYGWVKAHWHFLLAHGYFSDTGSGYQKRCAEYLSLIDEKNMASEYELEREAAEAGLQRRIKREVERHNGDLGRLNVALLLTYPQKQ